MYLLTADTDLLNCFTFHFFLLFVVIRVQVSQILRSKTLIHLLTSAFRVIEELPNTYVFSKALGEQVIADHEQILPVTIFRPSIGKCVQVAQTEKDSLSFCKQLSYAPHIIQLPSMILYNPFIDSFSN